MMDCRGPLVQPHLCINMNEMRLRGKEGLVLGHRARCGHAWWQVNPSFTHLGTLGGERPRTSLLWRRVRVRRGADGLALGSLQSLLLQELPVSLSLAVFPLTSPLLDEPCQHAVGAPAWEQSSRAERLVWPWWEIGRAHV